MVGLEGENCGLVYVFMPSPLWNVQRHYVKQENAATKSKPGFEEMPTPLWHLTR